MVVKIVLMLVILMVLSACSADKTDVPFDPTPVPVEMVDMPNVLGMQRVEASKLLEGLGFVVLPLVLYCVAPQDVVVEQSPQAGENVLRGTTVIVTTSGGVSPTPLPTLPPRVVRFEARSKGITDEVLAWLIADTIISADVTSLDLSGNYITDLSPLTVLTRLTSLTLNDNPLTWSSVLEFHASMPNTRVSFWFPFRMVGVHLNATNDDLAYMIETGVVSPLTTDFYLNDTTNITDISALAQLTNLRSVSVPYSVYDLSPLKDLPYLTQIRAGRTDILVLAEFTSLRYLDLRDVSLDDIPHLSSLVNLNTLVLFGMSADEIMAIDFSIFESLRTVLFPDRPLTPQMWSDLRETYPHIHFDYAHG
jgi:internalin A